MPKKQDEIRTGIKSLDDDLQELFKICEDEKRLSTIKETIADENISKEEFSKVVPESLIKLSLLFLSPPQFALVSERINKNAIPIAQKAKSLIEKHFSNLFKNKNVKSILEKRTIEESEESIADEAIVSINHYLIWEDDPPELTPAARIAIRNPKKKILLNTRMDWDDLGLFLNQLSDILAELIKKGKPLAELGQIDLSKVQKISKNIEETSENLKKIKEIMPIYKPETDKNTQTGKDS